MFKNSYVRLMRLVAVLAFSMVMLGGCGGGSSDTNTSPTNTAPTNTSPTATAVTIVDDNGDVALVGENLTGSYTYNDADADLEGTSTFRWLRNDVAISGATASTYTLVTEDSEQSITFEVTPVAVTGTATGIAETSSSIIISNSAPLVSNVTISGNALVGDTLSGSYTYDDADLDLEGTSTFRWLRNGDPISGAIDSTYTLVANDNGQLITFEVTPIAVTGVATGATVTSTAILINNYPPIVLNVTIVDDNGGAIYAYDTLTGNYSYSDTEGNLEGTSTFRWLRNDVAISGATASTYTLVSADENQIITFEVTPVAATGTITGLAIPSTGVIALHSPAFITTWKTDNAGISANDTILISTNNTVADYSVDWGDGVVEHNQTGDVTHTYSAIGTYTVKITGNFPRIYFSGASYDGAKLLSVENWGDINWTTMKQAFHGCSNLVVNATDVPNLSNVTDMSQMFFSASSFNSDISAWDTRTVTNMSFMFYRNYLFNSDLSAWDTGAVTNMQSMFDYASVFNSDLSAWDTGAVTNMAYMFEYAYTFNGDLSAWDTSAVTNMYGMFGFASAFNGDLSAWNTAAVTNMSYMFYSASAFTNHDLSTWVVTQAPTHVDFLTLAGTGNIEPVW